MARPAQMGSPLPYTALSGTSSGTLSGTSPRQLALLGCAIAVLLLLQQPHQAQAGFACLSSPCAYGICMDDLNSSFTCYCIDGYTGALCQTNWDECWSSPCLNGGICVDGVASFNCTCPDGFVGNLCEQDVNECSSNPCFNNATCLDGSNGFSCVCVPGYSGERCELDVAVCNTTGEARCQNGGVCQEGRGIDYSCVCLPGWTGELCEEPVNECESSPCHHGGVCVDLFAGYACACLFGYTGRHCEQELEPCARNPCLNGALCLLEDGEEVCYCVPDYHGDRCQLQYDECRRGPGCMNGGTCIDGVDEFSCTCPAGLTGVECECVEQTGGTLNCSAGAVPPTTLPGDADRPGTTLTSLITSSRRTPTPPTPLRTTPKPTTRTDPKVTTPKTTTPTIPTTVTTTSAVTSTPTESATTTGSAGSATSTAFSLTSTTAAFDEDLTTALTTIGGGGDFSSPSAATNITYSTYPPPHNLTTGRDSTEWTKTADQDYTPKVTAATSDWLTTQGTGTSPASVLPWSVGGVGQEGPDDSWASTTPTAEGTVSAPTSVDTATRNTSMETTSPSDTTTTPTSVSMSPGHEDVPAVSATRDPKAFPAGSPGAAPHDQLGGTPADDVEATTLPTTSTAGGESLGTPGPSEYTPPRPTESADDTGTADTVTDFLWSTFAPTSPVEPVTLSGTPPTGTDTTELDAASSSTTSATSGDVIDCIEEPCLNGATCEDSPEGARCMCAFGWSGPRCAEGVRVTSAAFAGHSFLVHRLPGTLGGILGTHIAVRTRTLAHSGLLLHAVLAPELYITLYLEDGLLKFQFSCGVQTMVFSEVQHRVNNGYELHVAASLEVLPLRGSMRPCAAALHVNHSLAMSGEQQSVEPRGSAASSPASDGSLTALLYLGGLPSHGHKLHPEHNEDAPLPGGLIGCLLGLEVDNSPRRIFEDAVSGSEVTECAALACLSAPCQSGGTCVQYGQSWNCLCPTGYVGRTCESSVCRNNPCKFGATCVPFPASGFLCLCPLGKHGLFCESDLEIAQLSFSPSVAGLSSFAAYSLPVSVEDAMELRFKFVPTTADQVGLMVFLGQDGQHDVTSDHLAVSFIKGYVVLTWNLGSGPRRIFTPRPLEARGQRPHSVLIGRSGSSAWLVADGMVNVTGTSPGPLSQLNIAPWLYLGGHDAVNFSGLPHDLPLHSGFAGCVLDVEVVVGPSRAAVMLERTRAVAGRAVGQCGTTLCHARACLHRAACLHHAATFSCLCPDGWFGPVCSQRFNPCDSTRNNCSEGSSCVPLDVGYECDCPVGRTGRYCEKEEALSDVMLSGRRSFLSLGPVDLQRAQSCLGVDVRPLADDGLLLHVGHPVPRAPSLALVLRGGLLEARLSAGRPSRREGVVTVRSRRVLARGHWHRVRVCRYGRRIFLWVDGAANSAALRPTHRLPPSGTPLYIGGAPDLSTLPSLVGSGVAVPLRGCVRGLSVNWRHVPLDAVHILDGRNVEDCDGTACGGEVCQHGGSCWLDEQGRAYCTCARGYSGRHCVHRLACDAAEDAAEDAADPGEGLALPCRNRGRCVAARCRCPAGWGGAFCEEEVSLTTPHFGGEGYLVVDGDSSRPRHADVEDFAMGSMGERMRERRDISFLYLNYSTTQDNGMILWSAQDDEVVGIGVEAGRMKVVWGWQHAGLFVALVPGPAISDGAWHDLALAFGPNVTLWTDTSPEPLHRVAAMPRPVASGALFYVGGFPGNKSVAIETRGVFNMPFSGCLQQVSWNQDSSVTDFSGYHGENVGSCELFEP